MTDLAAPYANQLIAALLLSLRLAPTLAFAPPFTLMRVPLIVRVFLSLSLAFWIAAAHGAAPVFTGAQVVGAALSELLFGVALSLPLQLAFAAILTAGRTLDFQVGFGLAVLADPTLRTQMPLVGALFGYAAGAVFFMTTGPADLVAIWGQTLDRIPIGAFALSTDLNELLTYISTVFKLAIGLVGGVVFAVFLIDIAVALMSRTLPQMNVMVLGFQLKTLALLLTLPLVFGFSGALFLRMMRLAIVMTGRLI